MKTTRLGIEQYRQMGRIDSINEGLDARQPVHTGLSRTRSICGETTGARYESRASGMRVKKITGLTIEWVGDEYSASGYYDENLNQDLPTVRYFYDGQMPMEEDSTYKENSVSVRDYTQYGLGARGIDYIRNVHHSSGEAVVFPIYDGHGNMVYTLSRGANETFSLGNKRIYGAWGDLRYDGNPNAGPNTQYCANLGHKKDNESGLTYMRARYYEPWTGRFISEDPARDGWNWYGYCGNNPIQRADSTGKFWHLLLSFAIGFVIGALGAHYSDGDWFLGGLAGGAAAVLGALTIQPLIAGFVSGFMSSVLKDLQQVKEVDWSKAAWSGLAGWGGGIAVMAIKKIVAGTFGRMGSIVSDGLSDWADEYGDRIIGTTGGLFGRGILEVAR